MYKTGDIVINNTVDEYLKNGKPNPLYKQMVIHVGTEYLKCIRSDGMITKYYTRNNNLEVVKHIDLADVILN